MSADKSRILIIDDSPEDIHFVMENLKEEFAVLVATDGIKGLELASATPVPDVILLDVVMPEMDGYEVCRELKSSPLTKDIDVIFISANDTTEEKLAGYDAGGSDYLIKPVQPLELVSKVKIAISNRKASSKVTEEKDEAFKTAMTAMSSAGEQGVILEFLRNSYQTNDISTLASSIVAAISKYDLACAIQIRLMDEVIHFGSSNPLTPIEEELLTRLKHDGRIIERGRRAVFNFGGVSALIKDMPDDTDRRGRLRDHLALLFEGADNKLAAISLQKKLALIGHSSKRALKDIEERQRLHKIATQQIVYDTLTALENTFAASRLAEHEEKALLEVVQSGIDRSLQHFERGMLLDEDMRKILDKLQNLG